VFSGSVTMNPNGLFVSSSGVVGIGTIVPAYNLDVIGNGRFTGNVNIDGERLTIGGTLNNAIINNIASVRINIDCDNNNAGESFIIGHNQTGIDNNNVLFKVQDDGNVGIGYNSPIYSLQVLNNIGLRANSTSFQAIRGTYWGYSTSYPVVMLGHQSTGSFTTVSIGYDPSGNANGAFSGDGREVLFRRGAQFVTPNAANNSFNLYNLVLLDGNVGIGTASPAQALEVNGNILASSTGKIGFRYSSTDGNYYSYLRSGTSGSIGPIILGGGFESGGATNEAIRFVTNANPGERNAVSILNSGRVGIGTTGPTTTLQIRKNYWQFWDEKTHNSNINLFSVTIPHFGAAIVTIAGSRYSPGADNYQGTSTFYIFITNTGAVSVNGGINFGTWSVSTSISSKSVIFSSAYAGNSTNYTGYSVVVTASGHDGGSESAAYVTIL